MSVLNDLYAIMSEADQLVQALTKQLRELPGEDMVAWDLRDCDEFTRLVALCDNFSTFVERNAGTFPQTLLPCLIDGGHFRPFVVLLNEAAEMAPLPAATWQKCVGVAQSIASKTAADSESVRRAAEAENTKG